MAVSSVPVVNYGAAPHLPVAIRQCVMANGLTQLIFGVIMLFPLAVLTGVFGTTIATAWVLVILNLGLGIGGLVYGCQGRNQGFLYNSAQRTPEEREAEAKAAEKTAQIFMVLTVVVGIMGLATVIHGGVVASSWFDDHYSYGPTPVSFVAISQGIFLAIVNLAMWGRLYAVLRNSKIVAAQYASYPGSAMNAPGAGPVVIGGYHPATAHGSSVPPPGPVTTYNQTAYPSPYPAGSQPFPQNQNYPHPSGAPPAYNDIAADQKF